YWEYKLSSGKWTFKEALNSNYASAGRTQDETVSINTTTHQRTTVRAVRDGSENALAQETVMEQATPRGWMPLQAAMGSDPSETRTYNSSWHLQRLMTPTGYWT